MIFKRGFIRDISSVPPAVSLASVVRSVLRFLWWDSFEPPLKAAFVLIVAHFTPLIGGRYLGDCVIRTQGYLKSQF